ADNKRNLCAHQECGEGDVDAIFADCDVVLERTYHTKAVQQTMMESFRTFCTIDTYGRLHITSATQIVFHVRRIVANALGIPKHKIRVTKPRVGGGFGAKQTAVCEMYPAFVTWKLKKPSKIVFSREECMIASSPRHEMQLRVRIGAMNDGNIRAIDLYTLSNTGAYGEHGPTTVGLTGHKSIPLYDTEGYRFISDVVYSNVMSAGAYRGYGATQGIFAVESAVNELAAMLKMDPLALRMMNITSEGKMMPAYYNAWNTSCTLDRCLARVKEMSKWDEKYPVRDMGNGKVRALGLGMAMQGSAIPFCDVGSASIKLGDEGIYNIRLGSSDIGTGSDTIIAQIAAEILECDIEQIAVYSADTDLSPYDSGSYASSTTYLTGKATEECALKLREKICAIGAQILGCESSDVTFDGKEVKRNEAIADGKNAVSLFDISTASMCNNSIAVEETVTKSTPVSPPPFMVGVAEIELDKLTGEVRVIEFNSVVDCGTPINPNLARVQAEGGILQGIGMALTENVTYNKYGKLAENSLMQYKIPTRWDIGHINVEFESSYEGTGPFGAKSIGEVVINTPAPAIADAIYNATGKRFYELPITPEKIIMG
ncbi:MAG: molybdopterin-dependent oxidoreductase, partial [Phascolarctobacterium sp.]|nr:molybdopterin-dependent oxidoreductase [Phascolarctobacterium sp.]